MNSLTGEVVEVAGVVLARDLGFWARELKIPSGIPPEKIEEVGQGLAFLRANRVVSFIMSDDLPLRWFGVGLRPSDRLE